METINDFKNLTKDQLIEKLYRMPLDKALLAICTLHDELHKYPKTYEECFNICFGNKHHIVQVLGLDGLGDNKDLFERFIKLKICRDAYWKIAGEQMGLGKSWKQDYDNRSFIIANNNGNIHTYVYYGNNNIILAFPTAEMRNTFYENFKDLIEQCKELL